MPVRLGVVVPLAFALLLAACATPPPRPPADAVDACRAFHAALDEAVRRAGVRDAQAVAVPDFPYLRIDRLLASFADELDTVRAYDDWLAHLRAQERSGRRLELANLPTAARAALVPLDPIAATPEDALEICAGRLVAADLSDAEGRSRLQAAATVPDEYISAWRVLGLYPLSGWIVSRFVAHLHREVRATFAIPLAALAVHGALRRYVPPAAPMLTQTEVASLLRHVERDALGIPRFESAALDRLFATFAPIYEVDVAGTADRLGAPTWTGAPLPQIDIGRPTLYRKLSYTRWQGQVLVQLNYIVWFPERPRDGAFDLLGGHLDGITWRVTLAADGTPLLYDSMHNCACYHQFFPVADLHVRPEAEALWEPPLVAQRLVPPPEGQRVVLRIAHDTHYLQRLHAAPADAVGETLAWADYDALRSLPLPEGGRRSLFDPVGIVPGSERRERYLLWPMGVERLGAMRQWGHHPIAFVGRRHFDEAHLLERLFELRPPQP